MPALAADHDRANYGYHYGEDHWERHRGAPAPLIGFGIPAALAVGGVLLGAKLRRRK